MTTRSAPMMRAKMRVQSVEISSVSETPHLTCVCGSAPFGPNGESEDNTFAKYSPSGGCTIQIANPALIGKVRPGMTFYVDFTETDLPEDQADGNG